MFRTYKVLHLMEISTEKVEYDMNAITNTLSRLQLCLSDVWTTVPGFRVFVVWVFDRPVT